MMRNPNSLGGVPVLYGDAAERFERICKDNAQNLAGSLYSEARENWVKKILSKRIRHD